MNFAPQLRGWPNFHCLAKTFENLITYLKKSLKEEEMENGITIEEAHAKIETLQQVIHQEIVGIRGVIEAAFIGLFSLGGNCHILLNAPPGTGKTTFVKTLSAATGLEGGRIQFAPDIMPGDIVGSLILRKNEKGEEELEFVRGPLFVNLLLADEINRARTTVKALILEPMEEGRVTTLFNRQGYDLPMPFMVFATQNPLEAEGTFPLGRAELDRFLMEVPIPYPSHEEEVLIARRHSHGPIDFNKVPVVMDAETVLAIRKIILDTIYIDDSIYEMAASIAEETRPEQTTMRDLIKPLDENGGASPRVPLNLIYASRVRAFLHGRDKVDPSDLEALALPILRHRLAFTAGEVDSEENIEKIVSGVCEKVLRKAKGSVSYRPYSS